MKILCFEIDYVGFKKDWQKMALAGKEIPAIKRLREIKTPIMGLKEAKEKVDAYMINHGVEPYPGYFEDHKK